MRELDDREKEDLYDRAICPACGFSEFYEGPSGGWSTNWFCANPQCLAGYNLTPPKLRVGQLIRVSLKHVDGDKSDAMTRLPERELQRLFKRKTTLRAWFDMLATSFRWGNRDGDTD
jgi:hypothetical protein